MNRFKKNFINISEKLVTEDSKVNFFNNIYSIIKVDEKLLPNVGNFKLSSVVKKNKALILLDASNIAMRHGGNKLFSTKGIQIAMNYFILNGHNVLSFLPEYLFKSKEEQNNYKKKVSFISIN